MEPLRSNELPLIVYCALAVLVTATMLASYVLGERHRDPGAGTPYESGIVSEGSARVRLSARFYLVAMFFVVFDLESVFLFAWAVAAREVGWAGYWEVVIFIGVLMAALIYLWRVGALDWAVERRTTR
ncbi:MAG TPA: NADH-quinone oxidoreductase subunit A [Nitrospira sp.]|nr:NADH-quinone oxidoreductase subunit A [Nitrospira sp.]